MSYEGAQFEIAIAADAWPSGPVEDAVIGNALRVFFLGKVPRTVNDDTLIAIGKEFFFSG